jgi:transcriptional regulator with XRE-family HTH domain
MSRAFDPARLRRIRVQAGITVADLAEEIEVSAPSIYHWETGHRSPSAWAIGRLADVLGCSVEDFYEAVTGTT